MRARLRGAQIAKTTLYLVAVPAVIFIVASLPVYELGYRRGLRPTRWKILRPPGFPLFSLLSVVYSRRTVEEVFEQVRYDGFEEYADALRAGLAWRARWISIRTNIELLAAAWAHGIGAVVRIASAAVKHIA